MFHRIVCQSVYHTVEGRTNIYAKAKFRSQHGSSPPIKGPFVFDATRIWDRSPGKLLPLLRFSRRSPRGKVNAGLASAAYWQGKLPAAAFFSTVPFGPEAPEYLGWMLQGNGKKLYQEMYDRAGFNVKVLPSTIISPETSSWFAKPISGMVTVRGISLGVEPPDISN